MRVAPLLVTAALLIAAVPCTAVERVEHLTDRPEAQWHAYIGKLVVVSGIVRFGHFGPAVTTGKGQLYVRGWMRSVEPLDEGEYILVQGLLHYQPAKGVKGRSNYRRGFFYVLHRQSIIRVSVS
jgi:hypothetical protein